MASVVLHEARSDPMSPKDGESPRSYFRIATNGPTGNTYFISVTCFGKLATAVSELLEVGRKVAVEARLRSNSKEVDGKKRYYENVVAHNVDFLDKAHQDSES